MGFFYPGMIILIVLCVIVIVLLILSFTIWRPNSLPVDSSVACHADADCDSPELECSENICVAIAKAKPCESNLDCESGRVCDTITNQCIKRTENEFDTCNKNSSLCKGGSVCINSKCYYCDRNITSCPKNYSCDLQDGLCRKLDYCCPESDGCYTSKYKCSGFTWCCPETHDLVLIGAGPNGTDLIGCPEEPEGTYTVGCIDSDGNKCYATWAEHGTCQQGGSIPKK